MGTILGMIDCDKKTSLLMMKCEDECTGDSFLSFQHEGIQNLVDKVKSEESQQILQDGLAEAYQSADSEDGNANASTTWGPVVLDNRMKTRSGPCKTPVA